MPNLSQNELEAMRILWECGPLKPGEIEAQFGWPIENATLRSVLRKLMEQGHVTREKEGRAYLYHAAASRKRLLQTMAHRMAQVFAGGSPAGLIAQLITTEKLAPEEIEALRRVAEEKPSPKRAKGRDAK